MDTHELRLFLIIFFLIIGITAAIIIYWTLYVRPTYAYSNISLPPCTPSNLCNQEINGVACAPPRCTFDTGGKVCPCVQGN